MLTEPLPLSRLSDQYGRVARSLRVSLTDRCNLRCVYCMPAEGTPWIPSTALLTADEVVRLIRIAVESLGVTRVRFTGGEPLLRPDLAEIVSSAAALRASGSARPELSLTTNGVGLDKRIEELALAGLNRVNVSLDAVDPTVFQSLTRRDRHHAVLAGLEATRRAGIPVKVNAVVMRDRNLGEILPLAHFCLERGHALRFIEEMPIGPPRSWHKASMVTAAEVLVVLQGHFSMSHIGRRGSAPAEDWLVAESACHAGGTIGFIASVTNPFCGTCDRTRITADGQVRTCLLGGAETDLRGAMRGGASDEDLAALWLAAHASKGAGHRLEERDFVRPTRSMSQIGG